MQSFYYSILRIFQRLSSLQVRYRQWERSMTCPRNPIFLHSIHRNGQGAAGPVSGCFPIDFHLLPSHTLILWDCLLLPLLFPCPDICIHTRGRPWFNFLRPFLPQFSARKKKKKWARHRKSGCESTADSPWEIKYQEMQDKGEKQT